MSRGSMGLPREIGSKPLLVVILLLGACYVIQDQWEPKAEIPPNQKYWQEWIEAIMVSKWNQLNGVEPLTNTSVVAKESLSSNSWSKHVPPALNSASAQPRVVPTSDIVLFDRKAYEHSLVQYPIKTENCRRLSMLQKHYHICTFERKMDKFVSGSILSGSPWERHLSLFLAKMLQVYGPEAILLDVGANIGSHTVFAAALGHKVWGVEPQLMNLVKVFHAVQMDGLEANVTLIQNKIDMNRQDVMIQQTIGNIGGSYVSSSMSEGPNSQKSRSVLFSDIFDQILSQHPLRAKLDIILKIDIESYECRAFLGSPQILNSTDFYMPYILMEWTYATGKSPAFKYPKACPRDMVESMSKLFVSNGYTPFSEKRERLVPLMSHTWNCNVLWQHERAKVSLQHL